MQPTAEHVVGELGDVARQEPAPVRPPARARNGDAHGTGEAATSAYELRRVPWTATCFTFSAISPSASAE